MTFKDRLKQARRDVQPKLTQADVARHLKVTPQAVSGWERGEAEPEQDKLISLAEMLRVDIAWLLGKNVNRNQNVEQTVIDHSRTARNTQVLQPAIPGADLVGDRDLPVFGIAQGGRGALILSSEPVDRVIRPDPLLRVKDGYGVIVVEDSMAPEFRSGDIALVNPHLPPRAGDTCIFRHRAPDGQETACIKYLRRVTASSWQVTEWSSEEGTARDFSLSRTEWQLCHVTVGNYKRR